jgi:HEAT repeat protein
MRTFLSVLAFVVLSTVGVAATPISELTDKLRNSEDFRVRVTAALELGRTQDPNVIDPLVEALDDPNASVRAAAAAALEQIGDASAVPALKQKRLDRSDAVRRAVKSAIITLEQPADSRPTKVLVQIGAMKNRTNVKNSGIEAELDHESRKKLDELPGIEVLNGDSRQDSKKKKLPVVLVSGQIQKLRAERAGQEIVYSASVEYIVHTMPEQSIAAKVSGNATASLSQEEAKDQQRASELRRQVLAAAIASALRGAPRALLAAARL